MSGSSFVFFKRRRTRITDPETKLYLSLSESFHFCLGALLNHQHTFNKIASHQNLFHHPRPQHRRGVKTPTGACVHAQTWPRSAPSIMSKGLKATCGGCRGRGHISQSLRRGGDKHCTGGVGGGQTRQPAIAGTQRTSFLTHVS